MKQRSSKNKNVFRVMLLSVAAICVGLISYSVTAAEISQQEIEMRKMVLEMVRSSMLQSCEGLQTLECVDLDEQSCKRMMSEVLSTCIEPAIDDPDHVDDGSCGATVMAKYGITEASAQRCGVKLEE